MKEKFYVVAERHNPQLGTYLSNVFVGTRRNNKASITCSYENGGYKESLRFSCCVNTTDGIHYCLNTHACVYGSMSYYGFESAELAKAYLEKHWSTHHRFESCIAKLAA